MIKNAALALFQTLFSLLALFFSYRLIVSELGVEALGLWALIVSVVSITRIAELGLSGSVLKYVSKYLAQNEPKLASVAIDSSTLSVATLTALTMVLMYLPVKYVILYTLNDDALFVSHELALPLAFISVWIMAISGVSKLALEGCQRYDFSTAAVVLSTLSFIGALILFIPGFGIVGLALSITVQQITLFVACRVFLKLAISQMPLLPTKFSSFVWKELINYGISFQIISIVKIFLDPITKTLLGKYGSVEAIGFYELASKFATQMRRLLIAMNQVLIPKVSENQAKGLLDIPSLYNKNFKLISYISTPFFTCLLCFVPVVETIWFQQREIQFEIFSIIAVLAFFVNTLCIPAYMMNLGTGLLRSNVMSHILMGIVNLVLGIVLGMNAGSIGVVVSWGVALMIGAIPILVPFHKANHIKLPKLIVKMDLVSIILGVVSVAISWHLYFSILSGSNLYTKILSLGVVAFIGIFVPMWFHPTSAIVINRLANIVSSR